jgi:hypothetical protein
MLLKTKDRYGKLGGEAGMLLKTNNLPQISGNVIEKKGVTSRLRGPST